jgi:hypothetical protein
VTQKEAKHILALYRPEIDDPSEPELREALEAAERDAELREWFIQQRAFQATIREKLRRIEPPPELQRRILEGRKIVRPAVWWRSPRSLAAAAAVVLLLGLATAIWRNPESQDEFSIYRSRMVRTALREYAMDIVSGDQAEVRRFLASRNAPADYVLPRNLEQFPLTGAGVLRWKNHPVSMVCFEREDKQMVFLFVAPQDSIGSPPPGTPILAQVNKLVTAGWTQDDKTYLLAGPDDLEPLLQ